MMKKYRVLFYVLFKGVKGNTWDILEETVTVPAGTPRNQIVMEASVWLDRRLERGFLAGLNPNVEHIGPIFPVYNIYECGERF